MKQGSVISMTAKILSVKDLISYALGNLFSRFGTLLTLCTPSLLVLVICAVMARLAVPPTGTDTGLEAELLSIIGYMSFGSLFATLALVPAFTGWHRLLITGNVRRENGRFFGWDIREWRYLGRLLAIWFCMMGVNIMTQFLAPLFMAGSVIGAVIMAVLVISAYAFIWAKLGLAMPAAALGEQTGFIEAMELAKGHTAQLAQALISTWLILGILGGILVMALTALGAAIGSQYLVFVGVLLFYYLSLVASVGVLSRAYSVLRT